MNIQLEFRKDDELFEVAELPRGTAHTMKNETLSDMIQSFSLNKLVLQNIPNYLDGYDLYICLVESKGGKKVEDFCLKYASVKSKGIIS